MAFSRNNELGIFTNYALKQRNNGETDGLEEAAFIDYWSATGEYREEVPKVFGSMPYNKRTFNPHYALELRHEGQKCNKISRFIDFSIAPLW